MPRDPPAKNGTTAVVNVTNVAGAEEKGCAGCAGCSGRLCGAKEVEVRTARRKTTSVRLVRSQSQRSERVAMGDRARARMYQTRSSASVL